MSRIDPFSKSAIADRYKRLRQFALSPKDDGANDVSPRVIQSVHLIRHVDPDGQCRSVTAVATDCFQLILVRTSPQALGLDWCPTAPDSVTLTRPALDALCRSAEGPQIRRGSRGGGVQALVDGKDALSDKQYLNFARVVPEWNRRGGCILNLPIAELLDARDAIADDPQYTWTPEEMEARKDLHPRAFKRSLGLSREDSAMQRVAVYPGRNGAAVCLLEVDVFERVKDRNGTLECFPSPVAVARTQVVPEGKILGEKPLFGLDLRRLEKTVGPLASKARRKRDRDRWVKPLCLNASAADQFSPVLIDIDEQPSLSGPGCAWIEQHVLMPVQL